MMILRTKKKRRPGQAIVTPDEARRAIYIDYEASTGRAPTLLGYRIDGVVMAGILEPLFNKCRNRYRARHAVAADHSRLVRKLVRRALREDRLIVSWSEFDYGLMKEALAGHARLQRILETHYRNAIYTAKRFRRLAKPGQEPHVRNHLALYLRIVRFPVPQRFGVGVAGKHLRLIRGQLSQGREYAMLTPAAKRAWQGVVRHNRYDLEGMAHIVGIAARRLSSSDPGAQHL